MEDLLCLSTRKLEPIQQQMPKEWRPFLFFLSTKTLYLPKTPRLGKMISTLFANSCEASKHGERCLKKRRESEPLEKQIEGSEGRRPKGLGEKEDRGEEGYIG